MIYPNNINVYINKICNLNCIYCYERKNDITIDVDRSFQFNNFCYAIKKVNINNITITGGEPLKCNFVRKYIQRAKSQGIQVALLTNGTLKLDFDIIRMISGVTFSVDGNEDIMKKHRGINNMISIYENIQACIKENCNININCVVTKFNLFNFEEGLLKILNISHIEKSLKAIRINAVDIEQTTIALNKQEQQILIERIYSFAKQVAYKIIISTNLVNKKHFELSGSKQCFKYPIWFDLSTEKYFISKEDQYDSIEELISRYIELNQRHLNSLLETINNNDIFIPAKGVQL